MKLTAEYNVHKIDNFSTERGIRNFLRMCEDNMLNACRHTMTYKCASIRMGVRTYGMVNGLPEQYELFLITDKQGYRLVENGSAMYKNSDRYTFEAKTAYSLIYSN